MKIYRIKMVIIWCLKLSNDFAEIKLDTDTAIGSVIQFQGDIE